MLLSKKGLLHSVVQDPELLIFLPLFFDDWNSWHVPQCPATNVSFLSLGDSSNNFSESNLLSFFIYFLILNYFPKFTRVLSVLNYIPDTENFMLWKFRLLILVGNEFGWIQNRSPPFEWQLKSQFHCVLLSWLKAPRCCGTGSPVLPVATFRFSSPEE